MQRTSRIALALSLVAGGALPANAVEVTPTGQLFSDYSLSLSDTLASKAVFNTFSVTRARIGLKATLSPDVWGLVQTDVTGTGPLPVTLKYGFVDMGAGFGRIRMGQFSTGWAVPVEESWYPFRYQSPTFATSKGLLNSEDRGIAWTGGMGMIETNVGVFNGEGEGSEIAGDPLKTVPPFTKAYEATVRVKPMDNGEIALHVRHLDAPKMAGATARTSALAGTNANLGFAVVGAEGGLNMINPVETKIASPSTGFGGSGWLYFPKLLMGHTPVFRVDYHGDDFVTAKASGSMSVMAGVAYEWAKGAETMLSFEHHIPSLDPKAPKAMTDPVQIISMKGKLAF